ncbi:hypothetical protein K440DRAFT_633323 [Wilcoxina mikolae CBS 423.85]|nr:hypothetical protein K440DRAFT_633323 [Wilcoxina mikolae CBS 423.85]
MIYSGLPIPDWSSEEGTGLTLNAMFSLLSTLSRSCLVIPLDEALGQLMWLVFTKEQGRRLAEAKLYNAASRGRLTSALKLILRKRGRGITSLGCGLMVLGIGLGFAQQQLITYPRKMVTTDDPTNETAVSSFVNGTFLAAQKNDPARLQDIDFFLRAQLYISLEDDNYVPEFDCPSGNCEYPTVTSLAVCSRCRNATTEVTSNCNSDTPNCSATYQNLTAYVQRQYDGTFGTWGNQSVDTTSPEIMAQIFTLGRIRNTWPPLFTAYSCELYWCIRTFTSKVTNSIYSETLTSSSSSFERQPNGSIIFTYDHPSTPDDSGVIEIPIEIQAMFKSHSQFFTGWASETPTPFGVNRTLNETASSELFRWGRMWRYPVGSLQENVTELYGRKAGVVNTASFIARGMTNLIREEGKEVTGISLAPRTVVNVRWWWLLYPIVVWVLTVVFWVSVWWRTRVRQGGMHSWGSSGLALLLWGVGDGIRKEFRGLSMAEAAEKAERVNVKLVEEERMWRMEEVRGERESEVPVL